MIEINFLPQELKTKSKKFAGRPYYFRYLVLSGISLLVCLHLYLAVMAIAKYSRFRVLSNKWQRMAPERKILDEFKKEYDVLSVDAQAMQEMITKRINFAEKLNKLSLNLPSGVWFNELIFSLKDFSLKGSVISLQKEEMGLINKFIDNLKNDNGFFNRFDNLELNSVQRRAIGGYDVVDFVLLGKLR